MQTDAPQASTSKTKLGRLYATLQESVTEEPATSEELAQKQFDTYLTLAKKHAQGFDDDPLVWWKRFKDMMPEMSLMARSYLCIQATSCASERLFSKAGFVVNRYRTSLKTDNVSMLTFLATNSFDD